MIKSTSSTIIFHSVNPTDGMLIQVSKRFVTDLLECFDDKMEKMVTFNSQNEDKFNRVKSYRDQIMRHVTSLE